MNKPRLAVQVAKKDHRCRTCGRRIPAGATYWRTLTGSLLLDIKEHTNCEDYTHMDFIPLGLTRIPKRPRHLVELVRGGERRAHKTRE